MDPRNPPPHRPWNNGFSSHQQQPQNSRREPSANAEASIHKQPRPPMMGPGLRQQPTYHLAQQNGARSNRDKQHHRSKIQQFQPQKSFESQENRSTTTGSSFGQQHHYPEGQHGQQHRPNHQHHQGDNNSYARHTTSHHHHHHHQSQPRPERNPSFTHHHQARDQYSGSSSRDSSSHHHQQQQYTSWNRNQQHQKPSFHPPQDQNPSHHQREQSQSHFHQGDPRFKQQMMGSASNRDLASSSEHASSPKSQSCYSSLASDPRPEFRKPPPQVRPPPPQQQPLFRQVRPTKPLAQALSSGNRPNAAIKSSASTASGSKGDVIELLSDDDEDKNASANSNNNQNRGDDHNHSERDSASDGTNSKKNSSSTVNNLGRNAGTDSNQQRIVHNSGSNNNSSAGHVPVNNQTSQFGGMSVPRKSTQNNSSQRQTTTQTTSQPGRRAGLANNHGGASDASSSVASNEAPPNNAKKSPNSAKMVVLLSSSDEESDEDEQEETVPMDQTTESASIKRSSSSDSRNTRPMSETGADTTADRGRAQKLEEHASSVAGKTDDEGTTSKNVDETLRRDQPKNNSRSSNDDDSDRGNTRSSDDSESGQVESRDEKSDSDDDDDEDNEASQGKMKRLARKTCMKAGSRFTTPSARKSALLTQALPRGKKKRKYIASDDEEDDLVDTDSEGDVSNRVNSRANQEHDGDNSESSEEAPNPHDDNFDSRGHSSDNESIARSDQRPKQTARKTALSKALKASSSARQSVISPPCAPADQKDKPMEDEVEVIDVDDDDNDNNDDDDGEYRRDVRRSETSHQHAQRERALHSSISSAPKASNNKEEHKKRRGDDTTNTSKPKSKRAKADAESEDEEFEYGESGDDSSEVVEEEVDAQLKTPSPFAQRRCRRRINRVQYTEPLLESPSPVAPKRDIARPEAPAEAEFTNKPDWEMTIVDHLSGVERDPETGLPVRKITCYGTGGEILYDFRVDIKQSKIPNAGFGAFLTYLGARHLKGGAIGKKAPKLNQKPLLLDELEAAGENGHGIHVKLCGESLDEAAATRPKGIGPDRKYTESDYEFSPTTVFSSKGKNNGLIRLGRYGPFRPNDRKPILHFDVKSFVFSYEPSEWCFGVEEKLWDRQDWIIDITDDLTGKTHDIARSNLCQYVNEVGHNKSLTQNVQALDVHDRSVYYFIDIEEPMKQGDEVELLTDYFSFYEDVRERKGYGVRNLEENLKDDSDPLERLVRNNDLRSNIVGKIKELDIHSLFIMLEFLEESIHAPLVKLTKMFLKDRKVPLLGRQLVALFRVQMVGEVALQQLKELQKTVTARTVEPGRKQPGYPCEGMIKQCNEWAKGMASVSFLSEFSEGDQILIDHDGKNVVAALQEENVESMWYRLRHDVESPLDPAIWCPIALDMVRQLSCEVEENSRTTEPRICLSEEKILRAATEAAKKVRAQAKNFAGDSKGLEFESGCPPGTHASIRHLPDQCKRFYDGSCGNPKGLLAGLLDIQGYVDSCVMCEDLVVEKSFSVPVDHAARFVMTQYKAFKTGSKMASLPKTVRDSHKMGDQINETWYIVWQVVFLAHSIATRYLPKGGESPSEYSLEKLCAAVDLDEKLAEEALEQRMSKKVMKIHTRRNMVIVDAVTGKTSYRARKSTGKSKVARHLKVKTNERKSSNSFGVARPPAIEISRGPPDEQLQIAGGWPTGWERRVFERQSGDSKGHRDRYWYSPMLKKKFRSIKEVKEFMACLLTCGGNESTAWTVFKKRKK